MVRVNRSVLVRCIDERFPLFGVEAKGTAPLLQLCHISVMIPAGKSDTALRVYSI